MLLLALHKERFSTQCFIACGLPKHVSHPLLMPKIQVFLKDTLEAAQNDAEQLVVERMHKKAAYIEQLEGVFRAIDTNGSGIITEERLSEILMNPKVKAYFQTMDLELHEGTALFRLLDNGYGEAGLGQVSVFCFMMAS